MHVRAVLISGAYIACWLPINAEQANLSADSEQATQACGNIVALARKGRRAGVLLDVGAGACPCRQYVAAARPDVHYVAHDFAGYTEKTVSQSAAATILKDGYCNPGLDIVSDITEIPLPDGSVDMIYCNSVLEHVPDPVAAFREIVRVMKAGGRLFIAVPLSSGLHNLPFHYYSGFTHRFLEYYAEKLGLVVDNMTYYFTPWTSDAHRIYQTALMFKDCLDGMFAKSSLLLSEIAPRALQALPYCSALPEDSRLNLKSQTSVSLELLYPDALDAFLRKLPTEHVRAKRVASWRFSGYVCPCRHLYHHKGGFGLTEFTSYDGAETHQQVNSAFNNYCQLEPTGKIENLWWMSNFQQRRYTYRQGYASCSDGPRQPLSFGKESAITWVGDFASLAESMSVKGLLLKGLFLNLGAADGVWSDPLSRYARQFGARGIAVEADKQRCSAFRKNFPHVDLFCMRLTKRTLPRVAAALNTREYDVLKIDLDSYDCFVLHDILHVHGHRPAVLIAEVNLAFPPPFEFAMEPYAAWDVTNTAQEGETTHLAFGCSLSYTLRLLTRTIASPRYVFLQIYKTDALFVRTDVAAAMLETLRSSDEFECYHLALLETGIEATTLRRWTYQQNVEETLKDMRDMIQTELSQRFGKTASNKMPYHLSLGVRNGNNASSIVSDSQMVTLAANGLHLVGFKDMMDTPASVS